MASYTIRIVLHAANSGDYEALHERMKRIGASRTIRGDDGVLYDLPDAEYRLENSQLTAVQVRDNVRSIAVSVQSKPDPSVLVSQAEVCAWYLRPVPGRS